MAGGLWLETLREASRFRYRAPSRITTAHDPSPLEEARECMPNYQSYVKDYFQDYNNYLRHLCGNPRMIFIRRSRR